MVKISIITVVFNGENFLEDTIKSVLAQTYPHIEYIIIDGKSKDNTVGIIKKYVDHINYWVSEPDKGLYDAMNKGLHAATGDFVWFVNAGDTIAKSGILSTIIGLVQEDTDVLFGEVMIVDENRKPLGTRSQLTTQKLPESLNWQSLRYGMVVSHQGFLPRRTLAPDYILGNLTADIDWVIECLKRSRRNTNTHQTLAEFQTGGISTQRKRQSLRDRFTVLRKHFGLLPTLAAHAYILWRMLFK
ncbi:MAG: hypothetical protein RI894_920 [Bacteroidota bacterium]|jgi:glycosyltransferase involved in cell wall biosynthesis